MAFELYTNNGVSTLSAGIDNDDTSLSVADGSVFPSTGNFRIRIDNELLLCTARSSNTLTVTRGAEGTTPASHNSGARVAHVLTAGAITQIRDDDRELRVFEARVTPSSGNPFGTSSGTSNLYLTPFQGNRLSLYNGTRWMYHPLSELTITVPSTIFRIADIFVYDNGGTLATETANWSQTTGTITGATNASPIVITSAGHGLNNGDIVGIAGVGGNTAANGQIWIVANVATDTFELVGSTGNGAYTSGGTWYKLNDQASSNTTTQDGILVKNGETNKRHCGLVMTGGTSGEYRVDSTWCHLVNDYNQIDFRLSLFDSNSHTYAGGTFRPWNNNGLLYRSFLVAPTMETMLRGTLTPQMNGDGTATPQAGIGLNGGGTQICLTGFGPTGSFRCSASDFIARSAGSYHHIRPEEARFTGGTASYTQVIMRALVRQ